MPRRRVAPTEPSALAHRYADAHRASMHEHHPVMFRQMQEAGTLDAHCRSVGASAERLFLELTESAQQQANRLTSFEEKLSILETARMLADSQVMRELVLVREPGDAAEG